MLQASERHGLYTQNGQMYKEAKLAPSSGFNGHIFTHACIYLLTNKHELMDIHINTFSSKNEDKVKGFLTFKPLQSTKEPSSD